MRRTRLLVGVATLGLGACVFDLDFYTTGGSGASSGTGGTAGTGGARVCTPGATAACYDGPPGTSGMGICKAGLQTCAPDGMSWGACAGEVLPQPPNCASGMDLHCDGKVPACKGDLLWSQRFGDTGAQAMTHHVGGIGVASDAQGNVLVTGEIEGTVSFGGAPLVGAGNYDVFVAKLGPDGTLAWAKSFGDASGQAGGSVAADADGNVFVTGGFAGKLDFGGKTSALTSAGGPDDLFAVKFDPAGNALWSVSFGDTSAQDAFGVVVDGAGDLVLAGSFSGKLDFGSAQLSSAGAQDVFVVKLSGATGAHKWSTHFPNASNLPGNCIAVDKAGNVVLAGVFSGAGDFGGGPIVSTGPQDLFVAKLASDGSYVWSKDLTSSGGKVLNGSVGVDGAGNVVVGGSFTGQIDVGAPGGPLASSGGKDVFVAGLQSDGAYSWSHRFGDQADQWAGSVTVDGSGNAIVSGYFSGQIDFGGGWLASAGNADGFLAKFDGMGTHQWSKRFGNSGGIVAGISAAADSGNHVLLTGAFRGSVDFGNGLLTATGNEDAFLARFSP